jgi:predicted enzyme related to lactoylglutathione lyase
VASGRRRRRAWASLLVSVEDPQAALDRAEELGGRTIMPVTELPQVTIALFADPEGHVIGLAKGM